MTAGGLAWREAAVRPSPCLGEVVVPGEGVVSCCEAVVAGLPSSVGEEPLEEALGFLVVASSPAAVRSCLEEAFPYREEDRSCWEEVVGVASACRGEDRPCRVAPSPWEEEDLASPYQEEAVDQLFGAEEPPFAEEVLPPSPSPAGGPESAAPSPVAVPPCWAEVPVEEALPWRWRPAVP